MEKHLLIIPCCKTKIQGGDRHSNQITYFENIEHVSELIHARGINMQNHPVVNQGLFMRAWDRYNGGLYTNLKRHQELIDNLIHRGYLDIIIVSALYGVINYNTEINDYDLVMTHRGLNGLWRNIITNSILNYRNEMNITHTHVALSKSYLTVANRNDGLRPIDDLWAYGYRGVPKINKHVSDNIIRKLNEIAESYN